MYDTDELKESHHKMIEIHLAKIKSIIYDLYGQAYKNKVG